MQRGWKLKAYPTRGQGKLLAQMWGHPRWVWNQCVELCNTAREEGRREPTRKELEQQLTAWKRDPEKAWLREIPASILQQKLRDFERARTNHREGRTEQPKFKSKFGKQSCRVQMDPRHAGKVEAWEEGKVLLSKLGKMKTRGRALPGTMASMVTLTKETTGKVFVSFVGEVGQRWLPEEGRLWRGVDVGLKKLMTFDNGETVENPRHGKKAEEKIRKLQQRLHRQEPGSKRRAVTKKRLAIAYEKGRNQRKDTVEKASWKAVAESQGIAAEQPHIHRMARSAKGTRAKPGKNVKQKAGLSKSLHDAGLAMLLRSMGQKAEWYGIPFVQVSPWFPSSKLCSECGHKHDGLTLADRTWMCPACGAEHDRDVNAARNILMEGLRLHAIQHPGVPGKCAASLAARGEGETGSPGPVAVSARIRGAPPTCLEHVGG